MAETPVGGYIKTIWPTRSPLAIDGRNPRRGLHQNSDPGFPLRVSLMAETPVGGYIKTQWMVSRLQEAMAETPVGGYIKTWLNNGEPYDL